MSKTSDSLKDTSVYLNLALINSILLNSSILSNENLEGNLC